MDARGRSYEAVGQSKGMLRLGTTLTLTGTSAGGAIAGTTVRVPFKCKIIGCSLFLTTGGTAVGPVLKLETLAAGTGAAAGIGTQTFGTQADSTSFDMSVTETVVAAGDHIRLNVVGGTIASTPVIGSAVLHFIEEFAGA